MIDEAVVSDDLDQQLFEAGLDPTDPNIHLAKTIITTYFARHMSKSLAEIRASLDRLTLSAMH